MRRSSIRLIAAAAFAGLMLWAVLAHTLPSYLANSDPELAHRIDGRNTQALLGLSDPQIQELVETSNGKESRLGSFARLPNDDAPNVPRHPQADKSSLRALSVEAIESNPLSAQAFANLGILTALDGEEDKANLYMSAAAQRSHRHKLAVYWMMRQSFEEGSAHKALEFSDALLRLSPQSINAAAPILGRLAEDRTASGDLLEILKSNPPWRGAFFAHLKGNITDARTPLSLLLALKTSSNPPTLRELQSYGALLSEAGLYELAYNAWLQFLPAEELKVAGFLFNGSFDFPSSGAPFDWDMNAKKGVVVDRVTVSGNPTLEIQFSGSRISPVITSQTTLLMPGEYVLVGEAQGLVRSRRGLRWRVRCISDNKIVGESRPLSGALDNKENFETSFSIPKENCRVQRVELAIEAFSGSDTMTTGQIRFDNLAIRRSETSKIQ